jgi:hypothetical protein
MPRHVDSLVSFDIPRDWDDRTIIAYAAPPSAGSELAANLVMTRDRLGAGEDLHAYGDRHVTELSKRLDDFALGASGETEIDGRPALSVSFSSTSTGGALVQRMLMVLCPERVVAAFTLTAPAHELAQIGPLFERIVSSIRFGGQG